MNTNDFMKVVKTYAVGTQKEVDELRQNPDMGQVYTALMFAQAGLGVALIFSPFRALSIATWLDLNGRMASAHLRGKTSASKTTGLIGLVRDLYDWATSSPSTLYGPTQ